MEAPGPILEAPGSILEAPGLHFGCPELPFCQPLGVISTLQASEPFQASKPPNLQASKPPIASAGFAKRKQFNEIEELINDLALW